ncbi:Aminotransferase-like, plant mobile domain, partial [Sesbania bispinosa]
MASELKLVTIESANTTVNFWRKRRTTLAFSVGPKSKTPPPKVRGTGNVLPPHQRKVAKGSLKYTYATWILYFFGDYDAHKVFFPGPSLSQPLKRAAFIAFWLSRYVFPGPPWESVSSSVFIFSSLLAEGVRLPLASFYLGGLYGRFDQCFLFERFPEYAPVRIVPEPSAGRDAARVEPRVWGWCSGRPRKSLLHLFDSEDKFVYRPYTMNFLPGVEPLHRLYHQDSFSSRNSRSSGYEGVFDLWRLILSPQCLPGFIITDTVSAAGQDAMKFVLFKLDNELEPFDEAKFIPLDRCGRVLDVWVTYYTRLRSSVKRYEAQRSNQNPPSISIMCKDPYFSTTTAEVRDRPAISEGEASKQYKPKTAPKRKKGVADLVEPPSKRVSREPTTPNLPQGGGPPTEPSKGV